MDKTHSLENEMDLDGYTYFEYEDGIAGSIVYKILGTAKDATAWALEQGWRGDRSQVFYVFDPIKDRAEIEEWIDEAEEV